MISGAFIDLAVFTPQRFGALAPHMQTEALLLAVECGNRLDVVAASLDMPTRQVAAILRARHLHAIAYPALQAEPDRDYSRASHRQRIARLIRERGGDGSGVPVAVSEICGLIGVSSASVARALRQMTADGWIVRTDRRRPGQPACYRLTERGMDAAWSTPA